MICDTLICADFADFPFLSNKDIGEQRKEATLRVFAMKAGKIVQKRSSDGFLLVFIS